MLETMDKTWVREMGQDELHLVRPLVSRWPQEARPAQWGVHIDPDKFLRFLHFAACAPDAAVLLSVAGRTVTGFLVVSIAESVFGPDRLGTERFWYVAPEKRGRQSLRLLQAARQWCAERGCTHFTVTASHLAGGSHNSLTKHLERQGYNLMETSYVTEIR